MMMMNPVFETLLHTKTKQVSNSFYITSAAKNITHLLPLIKEIFMTNTLSHRCPYVWTLSVVHSSFYAICLFVICHEGATDDERSLNPIFKSFKVCLYLKSAL